MTRPKADSDPWLTDPISRDRVIAKVVVEGIREIIGLLRAMRDEQASVRALEAENRELRGEVSDLWRALHSLDSSTVKMPKHGSYFPPCKQEYCTLPDGHPGNHRGSLRAS